jgi:hypothetical protein
MMLERGERLVSQRYAKQAERVAWSNSLAVIGFHRAQSLTRPGPPRPAIAPATALGEASVQRRDRRGSAVHEYTMERRDSVSAPYRLV